MIQAVLATKFGMDLQDGWSGPRGAGEYIRHAIQESLRRLQTDTIDLYWYHRPDGITPIADTLEALDALVKAGTVRAIGASNFSAQQIEGDADSISVERGLFPAARRSRTSTACFRVKRRRTYSHSARSSTSHSSPTSRWPPDC